MTSALLRYTSTDTACGPIWIVASDRGLVALSYTEGQPAPALEKYLRRKFPGCDPRPDDKGLQPLVAQVRTVLAGKLEATRVPLDLRGTPFQVRVWQELAKVPWGRTLTYSELAAKAGNEGAVRAVASACARNPIGLVVPCHRILRKGGGLGGYYYGLERKRRLLELEGAV